MPHSQPSNDQDLTGLIQNIHNARRNGADQEKVHHAVERLIEGLAAQSGLEVRFPNEVREDLSYEEGKDFYAILRAPDTDSHINVHLFAEKFFCEGKERLKGASLKAFVAVDLPPQNASRIYSDLETLKILRRVTSRHLIHQKDMFEHNLFGEMEMQVEQKLYDLTETDAFNVSQDPLSPPPSLHSDAERLTRIGFSFNLRLPTFENFKLLVPILRSLKIGIGLGEERHAVRVDDPLSD